MSERGEGKNMSEKIPQVVCEHININDSEVMVFSVKDGLAKIGICRINSEYDKYCLYSHDAPVMVISGGMNDDDADKVISEYGSASSGSIIAESIDGAYARLAKGGSPEYALEPFMRLLPDGLYAVTYVETYPTAGESMFFWSGYGVSKQLRNSSRNISVIGDKAYSAPFLIPTEKPSAYDPSLIKKASAEGLRNGDLFGISLHFSGLYSVLLKGHYAACAAAIEGKPFYTVQIQPLNEIWKITDENGEKKTIGFSSASFRVPFESLTKEQLRIGLTSRKYVTPDTYDAVKQKLGVVPKSGQRRLPKQLDSFSERYPDADMVACAQGVEELTKPMLDALLAGQTELDGKVIISENYYNSVTAACNYLRYHNKDDFIDFALDVVRNPELSATYTYVASCLAKVHDERINQFFTEVKNSGDAGYSKIIGTARSYIDNYDKHVEVSSEDFFNSLPEPKKGREHKEIIHLTGDNKTSAQLSGETAKLMAAHLASMIDVKKE